MAIEFHRPVYDEGDVWREESWTAHSAEEVGYHNPIEVDTCVFFDGEHYPGFHCPHYNDNDPVEEQPGWTVLQIPKGQ